MTTKVSDERLAALANWWGGDTQLALHELQEKRALVKDCVARMKHEDTCQTRRFFGNQYECSCGLDALLARVRGEG